MGYKILNFYKKRKKVYITTGSTVARKKKGVRVFVCNDVDASRGELYQNYKNSVYSAIVVRYES